MFRAVCILLIPLLIVAQSVHAQETIKIFKQFRVLLKSGERYEGKEGHLSASDLEGTLKGGESMTIPRDDIRALDVSRGSNAGKYAMIGAGIGLLTSLTAALAAWSASEDDPLLEFQGGTAVAITAGFTIAGGLIGAAFGATQLKWERVPVKTSLFYDRHSRTGVCAISIPF